MESYSIKEYFDKLYNSGAATLGLTTEKYAAMKTLLADTLEYGAAAQVYAQYNEDDLANSLDWVAEEKVLFNSGE